MLGFLNSKEVDILQDMYDTMSDDSGSDKYGSSIDLRGLMGAPPCFSELADYRNKHNPYGYEYMENFIEDGNFVAISVGTPKLLGSKSGKEEIEQNTVVDETEESEDVDVTALLNVLQDGDEQQLFSFNPSMVKYWKDVRILISICADMLGLNNYAKMIPKSPNTFRNFNWGSYASKFIQTFTEEDLTGEERDSSDSRTWEYVPFYNNGVIDTSESMSNTVGPSNIEQKINSAIPAAARSAGEFAFLTGQQMGDGIDKYSDDEVKEEKGGMINSLKGMFGKGASLLNVQMNLPDVWKDYAYTKEYNLKFKFSSPHGDPFSIFMNVIVPLCHLLPMVTARQVALSSSYVGGYILRIYCKGMVNLDMGMATNVVITRNQKATSVDGLPTEIEVTVTVKDIMPMLALPEDQTREGVVGSHGLFGYLGTLCGFNVNYNSNYSLSKVANAWSDKAGSFQIDRLAGSVENRTNQFLQNTQRNLNSLLLRVR